MKKSDQDGAPPACLGYGQGEGEPKNMNSRYHVIFLELLYFLMHKVQGVSVHSDQCDKGNFDHHKLIHFPFHEDHGNSGDHHSKPTGQDKFLSYTAQPYNSFEPKPVKYPQHSVEVGNEIGRDTSELQSRGHLVC